MIPIPLQGFHKGAHPRAKCLQLVSPRRLETSELVFTVPDVGIQRTNSPSGVEGERRDKMECQLIFVFPGSSKCWQATSWRVGGRGLGTTFNLLVFIDILLALGQGMLKLATVIGSCPHPVLQLMYLLLELFQLLETLFLFPLCIPLAPVEKGMDESVCLWMEEVCCLTFQCTPLFVAPGPSFPGFFQRSLSLMLSAHSAHTVTV